MAATDTQFAKLLDLEHVVMQGTNCLGMAMNQVQAAIGLKADKRRLHAALDTLTDEDLTAYAAYRKINKWW